MKEWERKGIFVNMKSKNPKTDSTRISFDGQKYCGIKELGFSVLPGKTDEHFIVNLHTSPVSPTDSVRGGYFTCIPISPLSYRRKSPTSVSYFRSGLNRMMISNDWGHPYNIVSTKTIIDELVMECKQYGIPEQEKI